MTSGRRLCTAFVVATALITASCSSSGHHQGVASTTGPLRTLPPGTSPPTTGTGGGTTDAAQLSAAVRAFWDVYLRLGGRTGPFDATYTRDQLETRATGQEASQLFDYFQSNALSGYVVRGTISIDPTVQSLIGSTATLSDCYDDATGLYRVSDGVRLDSDNPARHQVLLTLQKQAGVWKVATITNEGTGCSV